MIIETKNLRYTYGFNTELEKNALDSINVSIKEGEFVGIIGKTGSGKSTFIKQLNGLLRPTSGKVFFKGNDIWENKKNIKEIRFKVGIAFQHPDNQLFEDTVYKDISFGPCNMGLSVSECEKRVLLASKFCGIDEKLLSKSPFELSGGEKRKVAIAGVVAMNPEVLILDEPTSGLDPKGKNDLIERILSYHKRMKNTVIFVSHRMEDVAKISDRIIVMDDGQVKMFDTPKNVFKRSMDLKKIGLDVPQITRIMHQLRKRGYSVDDNVLTVDSAVCQILKLINARKASLNNA